MPIPRTLAPAAAMATLSICPAAHASFHLWEINEIYSNADGSIQFIELFTSFSGQQFTSGERITSTSGLSSKQFVFPNNTPAPTGGRNLLLATPGFAAFPGAPAPDFILPASFLFQFNATVNFVGADVLGYTALPTDGLRSLAGNGAQNTVNTPTNFAGDSGTVPAPGPIGALALAGALFGARRRRPR